MLCVVVRRNSTDTNCFVVEGKAVANPKNRGDGHKNRTGAMDK